MTRQVTTLIDTTRHLVLFGMFGITSATAGRGAVTASTLPVPASLPDALAIVQIAMRGQQMVSDFYGAYLDDRVLQARTSFTQ